MVCYSPLKAYRGRRSRISGKLSVHFSPRSPGAFSDRGLVIPCGKCEGCLLARSFQWSVRCTCESFYHKENYFLTLTYDKEHLPSDRNLVRAHFQGFMKRLRYYFKGYKLKVFYCGEYGETRHRPHYHAIIFGLPLQKENYRLYFLNSSKKGNRNYYNPKINEMWGKGNVAIGSFSSSSASYVAQYTLKKNKSKFSSFVATRAVKPFIGCSNRPAIGYQFFSEFWKAMFIRGFFAFSGNSKKDDKPKFLKPLPVFKRWLERDFPLEHFKYVVLPQRRANLQRLREAYFHPSEYAAKLDKRLRDRYYKERATLRKLEARCDL